MDELVLPGPTGMATGIPFGIFTIDKHLDCSADVGAVALKRLSVEHCQRLLQPTPLYLFWELVGHPLRFGVWSRRVLEHKGAVEPDLLHQVQGRLKVLLSLARKSDDDVRGNGDLWRLGAQQPDLLQILIPIVAALHSMQDPIGARLH